MKFNGDIQIVSIEMYLFTSISTSSIHVWLLDGVGMLTVIQSNGSDWISLIRLIFEWSISTRIQKMKRRSKIKAIKRKHKSREWWEINSYKKLRRNVSKVINNVILILRSTQIIYYFILILLYVHCIKQNSILSISLTVNFKFTRNYWHPSTFQSRHD